MPSIVNVFPTTFENDLFSGTVSVGATCPRLGGGDGEFQRPCINLHLTIYCKAMADYYGEHNHPEIQIRVDHLPQRVDAVVLFLEKLDLAAFVPETAPFYTMDSALDLAAFSARAAGVPADVVNEVRAEITATEDRENKTKIPGLPYNEPMRPDLFFNEFREQFIADARNQLEGIVD